MCPIQIELSMAVKPSKVPDNKPGEVVVETETADDDVWAVIDTPFGGKAFARSRITPKIPGGEGCLAEHVEVYTKFPEDCEEVTVWQHPDRTVRYKYKRDQFTVRAKYIKNPDEA